MRFISIGLRNYRNVVSARLDLSADRIFFLGKNGQGKTNLLESIGLITSLRAFRSHENGPLIGGAAVDTEIAYALEHERYDEIDARVLIKSRGKEAWIDGESIRRVSDFVGRFPTVVMSSEDLSLVRGSPGLRRRYLDTFLCGVDRGYFVDLQRYQKCVQERNALLKQEASDAELDAFEKGMLEPASSVYLKRASALETLGELACEAYSKLSSGTEAIGLAYKPNVELDSAEAYERILKQNRRRDRILQSTSKGPHRDDFDLLLNDRPADDYASDGQQRAIALSLAFAIIAYWRKRFGFSPVVLADDALGELDGDRRARFWAMMEADQQIIATGTRFPESEDRASWLVYLVDDGVFTLEDWKE